MASGKRKGPTSGAPVVTLENLPEGLFVPKAVRDRLAAIGSKIDDAAMRIMRGIRPSESPAREDLIEARQAVVQSARMATRADIIPQERLIGSDDLLPISFFSRGMLAAQSVARIARFDQGFGTGFLVAPDILMTAHHVVFDEKTAAHQALTVEFELIDREGRTVEIRSPRLDPARFFFTDPELDVTFVGLRDPANRHEVTEDLGWHPMILQEGKIRVGDAINIIQHPGGRSKTVVVHNSNLLYIENGGDLDPFLWYSSDTDRGSSGAPIFNSRWEVVGVHHRSVPATNKNGELLNVEGKTIDRAAFLRNPDLAVWIANEGTRTSRIVTSLTSASFDLVAQHRTRDATLALWEASRVFNQGQEAAARTQPMNASRSDMRTAIESSPTQPGHEHRAGGVSVYITVLPDRRG